MEIKVKQEYREYTVEEVFDALKRNGFTHIREEWVSLAPGAVGACAIGQAALNLQNIDRKNFDGEDVEEDKFFLATQLNRWKYKSGAKWWPDSSYPEDRLGLGDIIVFWNDRKVGGVHTEEWALKTYDEIVSMAYDVLAPHFAKKVKLAHYEY